MRGGPKNPVNLTAISGPRDDVGHEVSAYPPNNSRIDISDLKKGRHLWVPGAAINVDYVGHPPVVWIGAPTDDRHAGLHRQEHGRKPSIRTLERDNGMIDRHHAKTSTSVLAVVCPFWQQNGETEWMETHQAQERQHEKGRSQALGSEPELTR